MAEARFGKPIHILWQEFLPRDAKEGLYWGHPRCSGNRRLLIRGRVVIGEVHDLNAAVLGGKSTHAGLFGSASSLTKTAQWSLDAYHGRCDEIEASTVKIFGVPKGAGSHCLGMGYTFGIWFYRIRLLAQRWHRSFGIYWNLSMDGADRRTHRRLHVSNRVHPRVEGALPSAVVGPKQNEYRAFRPKLHAAILKL